MTGVDVVVVGAGPNGLVAAATLAAAGWSVALVEARERVGGIAAGEAFAPGFTHTGLLHDSARIRPAVVDALRLEGHGLSQTDPAPIVVPRGDAPLTLRPRVDGGYDGDVGPDADGLAALGAFVRRIRPFASAVLDAAPPSLGEGGDLWSLARTAVGLRRLGRDDMMALLRVGPTCVDDFVSEYVGDPALRAALCAPALVGAWMGPRSPSSTANWLLHEVTAGREVVGGPAGFVRALARACEAHGVRVLTGAKVRRIRVEDGRVSGVVLDDGVIDAPRVLAACAPSHALSDLVDPIALPGGLDREIRTFRTRGTTAKVHLGVRGPVEIAGRTFERARIGAHPLDLERAFDAAKYRTLPERPPLDVRVPTVADPALAPDGHHVVSVLVHGVPYHLDAGWTDAARQTVGDRAVAVLAEHVPDLRERIVAREVLTPADLEARYGLPGGHLHHGEHALDQLWAVRPCAALSGYATPIRGLFLGSSGAHPGGGLTGMPGLLAARAALG